jgi:hypothetical protein
MWLGFPKGRFNGAECGAQKQMHTQSQQFFGKGTMEKSQYFQQMEAAEIRHSTEKKK